MPTQTLEPAIAKLAALGRIIGNTPLLGIHFRYRGTHRVVYAKSEQMNMTGSIKDRMALHIVRQAYASGRLRPGMTIVEATSGNTGIAFAAIGRALGHPVEIYMPDWMSRERKDLIRSYGAQVLQISKEEGGFLGSIARAETRAADANVFCPEQFSNIANVEAHASTTGPEIWSQMQAAQKPVEAFVAGVGTGGTVMGVGRFLRSKNPYVKIHPAEPAESPTLTTGHKVGKHRIQGISDEFIPSIVKLDELDDVIAVHDGDSIIMAQKLASQLGLAVGISSGCNFLAALKVQETLGPSAVVVTVFADDNKKYLSTDLMKEEPVGNDYLSPEIELTGLSTLQRSCAFCDGNGRLIKPQES
jgi:cysteine synthase A